MSTTTVRLDQIWADNDPRSSGRFLRVSAIDGDRAAVREVGYDVTNGIAVDLQRKRISRIRLDRFRPTSSGYRLVVDIAVRERLSGGGTVWHRPHPAHDCARVCNWHPLACSASGTGLAVPLTAVPVDLRRAGERWCPTCRQP